MTIKFSQFLYGGEMRVNDQVAGLRSGNNYRFDFPGTGIKDSTGAYLIKWLPGSGTPVNYVQVTSASSTNPAVISAVGGDTNINLSIGAKGTGHAFFSGTGAFGVPVGTTAQEPTGFAGGLRYDTDTDYLRYWDIGANAWVDIINGAALADLTYVTNTDETADLPNSQPLSALATGLMVVTTGTGIVTSVALPLGPTNGGTGIATYTLGDTLYASAVNTLSKLAGNTTAVKQYLSQTGTGAVSAAPVWATISGSDITGAALTRVDDTNVTLTLGGTPTTALLRATSLTMGWTGVLSMARGGSNKALVADNGGIVYSDADSMEILAATATAGKVLQSGSNAAPSWSTPTYPSASGAAGTIIRSDGTNNLYTTSTFADTYAASSLLYSNGANTVTGLATANSAVLVTTVAGVPIWSASLTNGQVILGSTGATPVAATITGSGGITITAGAGTLNIAGSGGTVTSVTGTANQIDVATGTTTPVLSLSSTLIAPGTVTVGNLLVSTSTISATNAGGSIILTANTTGVVEIGANSTKASTLRFREDTDNGTNYVQLRAATTLAADIEFILPNALPTVEGLVMTGSMADGTLAFGNIIGSYAQQNAQETGTDLTSPVVPGTQQYHNSAAKAWARVDNSAGTPTLTVSYNVTSLTDNGAGDFTVNFTVAFSTANYVALYTGSDIGSGDVRFGWLTAASPTTTACRFLSANAALSGNDGQPRFVAFYGDQ